MPVNDFKAFATGEHANVLSQPEFEDLEALGTGFQSGIARSEELNKVWRQASTIASVVASFMASKSGNDVLDNGNLDALQATLLKALLNNSTSQLDGRYLKATANLSELTNAGTARGNLGLKGAAVQDIGTVAGTVAAGNDARIVNAVQRGNNLSDLTDKSSALVNLNGVPKTTAINGRVLTGNINVTAQDIFNGQSIPIPDAADLNTFMIPGLYYQSANAQASTGKNYPEAQAGSLEIYKHAGFTQVYRIYGNSKCYIRTYYGGTWAAWARVYDTAYKPTPAEIGALSLNGGTLNGGFAVVANSNAISMYADPGQALYLLAREKAGTNLWYVGKGGVAGTAGLYNYIGTNGVTLNANGSISLNASGGQPIVVNTQVVPTNYANFDARYQAKGSYTPAGQAYTKAESDSRFPLKTSTVIGVRVSARGTIGADSGTSDVEAPIGNFMTGHVGSNGDVRYGRWYVRALQVNINGTWRTITV
ncbi:pyocin knob domain-containing protein [Dryocola sp. BD613]|uniref:pyocin knob domain-containing protein n=1 Tax=Dryocola sp. BD613 TaxID=3133272 RepID=UPI003F5034F8